MITNRAELIDEVREGTFQETGRLYDRDTIAAFLTALEAAGVCLVPKEATEEMVLAGANLVMTFDDQAKDCYAAMLSASPYRP